MKNWKTTLAGLLTGALMLIGGALNNRAQNPSAPPVTVGNLAPAIAIAVMGMLAKDGDVTGGTRKQ